MQNYPLSWPPGWKRTNPASRSTGTFGERARGVTVAEGVGRVLSETRKMGVAAGDTVISTNLPVRLDGLPYSDRANPADPGVAVYWRLRGKEPRVIAVDRYHTVGANLAAISVCLEAFRSIERHGGAVLNDHALSGLTALPAPGQTSRTWGDVLGFRPGDAIDADAVKARYRTLAGQLHSDHGGTDDQMAELNVARQQALDHIREVGQ